MVELYCYIAYLPNLRVTDIYHNDTQAQINSMIKMKLIEMNRVKAVWNKYAANKIIVTIIKS